VEALFPLLNQENIPYFLLGSGSNVIAKDEGYHGLILSFERLKKAEVKGNVICAQSGMSVTALANLAKKHSLMGMEFFYGIPGSVGGAVFMNAGAYGGECKNILKSVTFITREGQVMTLPTEQLQMGYRTSLFETNGAAILSAEFSLEKGDPLTIGKTMDELMEKRRTKQPLEYPSAGSTFKRCEGRFTAQMIDEAGLKGARVGGAMVSEKHAGFIINYDNATSADIFELIALVKQEIFKKEGLSIQCEVRVIE
jgi:UDP-N-acetylmuramate dehydrogenase